MHAYGATQEITDIETLRDQQIALIAAFEGPDGWSMDVQPENYIEGMLRGVSAFEMPIDRLEGKFKLSQNRPAGDRDQVADALSDSAREGDRDLAALMKSHTT